MSESDKGHDAEFVALEAVRRECTRLEASLVKLQEENKQLKNRVEGLEAALKQSELQFTLFMRHLPGLSWIKDDRGRYIYANEAAERAFATPWDMLRGKTDVEVFPSETAIQFRLGDIQALNSPAGVRTTETLLQKDGILHHSIVSKFPIPHSDSSKLFVGGIAIDITEHKQADEALQRMRFCVDHAGESVFWVSRAGRILYANQASSLDRGYTHEELLSMTIFDLDPDFQPDIWNPHFEELKRQGSMTFETRHRAKDGRIFPVEVHANYVQIGDEEFNFAFVRDITERKRNEGLLRGQNQILEMIAANSPLADTLAAMLLMIEAQASEILCSIFTLDDDGKHFRHGVAPSLSDDFILAIKEWSVGPQCGSCGTAVFRREAVIVEDIALNPLWKDNRELALRHGLRACWSTPILDAKNHVLGTFAIYQLKPGLPTAWHQQLTRIATRLTAIAIRQRQEQDALRESEERFQGFLNQSPVVAWVKDEKFLYRYVNSAFEQLFDMSAHQILGKEDFDFIDKESASTTRANDLLVLNSGEIVDTIEHVPGADGKMRSWLVQKFPLHRTGQPTWVGGTAVDVTSRRETEEALRQSETRFRQLVEASPNAIVMFSQDGRIVLVNHETERLLRYSSVELKGQHVELLFADWFRDEHPEFPDGHEVGTLSSPRNNARERHVRRKDGSQVAVETGFTPIELPEGIFTLATITDITDRRLAEATLRESEARFRLLFEGANDAIVWADIETGLITHCNPAAERLLGRDRSEIIGQSQAFLHPPEEMDRYRELFRIHATTQSTEPMEVEVLRKDGRRVDVSISPSVTDIGEQRIIQGIFRDISERKRMEAELSMRQRDLLHVSRLNAVGQMVAGLSHEVAQPLSAIANFAKASTRLLNTLESPHIDSLKEYTQMIKEQSQRCGAILQRLRDFSRRAPTRKTMCDLGSLLTETAELIAPEMRLQNVSVRMELLPHLPKISADRVQIQQVIFNLLYNGLDAVRDEIIERRRITIRSSCESEWVIFEVEDHGRGISPEIIGNLFEPFFTTKEDGMGIGLNICETIVRDHGGKIGVDSNRYGGATFRVRLPVHREY